MKTPKAVDRQPFILAAGKPSKISDRAEVLYKLWETTNKDNDLAGEWYETDMRKKKRERLMQLGYDRERNMKRNNQDIRDGLEPESRKNNFMKFEEEFYENRYYKSTKTRPLGQCTERGAKPPHITSLNTRFGRKIPRPYTLYSVILPDRPYAEVAKEEKEGYPKYLKSHRSYAVGERVPLAYKAPNIRFGMPSPHDDTGNQVKKTMEYCDKNCFITSIQDELFSRNKFNVGVPRETQNLNLPSDYEYGRPVKADKYNVKYLIQREDPFCPKLDEFYNALEHISKIRHQLQFRDDFYFPEVETTLRSFDEIKSGKLKWETIFSTLLKYNIFVHHAKCKLVGERFNLVDPETGLVDFMGFLRLLMLQVELPPLKNLYNFPVKDPTLLTTYREFATDGLRKMECPQPYFAPLDDRPRVPKGYAKLDLENLFGETSMLSLITPTIAMQFGLNHRDYCLPRTKEEIERIFKKILVNIPETHYNNIWDDATKMWTSKGDKVSVEAFKCALRNYKHAMKLNKH